MKTIAAGAALLGVWLAAGSHPAGTAAPWLEAGTASISPSAASRAPTEVIEQYCVRCHNERRLAGNLTLATFDVERAHE
ncbi:MAG: hypothetical protein IIA44_14415, partial [Acidobacteria bacterium]|nr:hypothetical protein [Acidobacteriota bacterium]